MAVVCGLSCHGAGAGETPSFRFVHLTDTHCAHAKVNPRGRYLFDPMVNDLVASFDLLEAAVREINQQVKPDFVIVTGDLVDRRTDLASLRRVKAILGKLTCPCYPVIGDHDSRKTWRAVFGADRLNYTFARCGWRFIALDSSLGRLDKPTLEWLRRQLDAQRDVPTALLIHRPLVLPGIHSAAAKAVYGVPLLLGNAADARRIVEGRANVRAVFAGHCHAPSATKAAGIEHHVGPALITLGHHFAVVAVSGGTIATSYRAVRLADAPAPQGGGRR